MTVTGVTTTPPTLPAPPSGLSDIAAAIWLQIKVISMRAGDDMALVLLKRHVASGDDAQAVAVLEAYEQALHAYAWAEAMGGDNVQSMVDSKASSFIRERVIADSELADGIFGQMPAGGISERMLLAIVALLTPERTTESMANFHVLQELLYGWAGSQKVQSRELTTLVIKTIDDRLREEDFASGWENLPDWMLDPKTHASVLKKLWNAYLANCGEQTMINLARIITMIQPNKFPKLMPGCADTLSAYAHRMALLNFYLESIDAHLRDQQWYGMIENASDKVKVDMVPSGDLRFVTITVDAIGAYGTANLIPELATSDILDEINGQRHGDFSNTAVRLAIAFGGGPAGLRRYHWAVGEKAATVMGSDEPWPGENEISAN